VLEAALLGCHRGKASAISTRQGGKKVSTASRKTRGSTRKALPCEGSLRHRHG
jgi:hypothetical protein